MKTLGIEMSDAGFEVAVGRAASGASRASAEWLVPPGSQPAMAVDEKGTLHFGTAAEERRMLFPREVCESFWEDLSLQPSNLSPAGRTLGNSELAFHFLRHLVNGLPGVASEHESLVVAVPPSFSDGSPRAEGQVGILLGICGDLELRLAAIVDSAVAAVLDPDAPVPARGAALVVDLGLHAANLTVVETGETAVCRHVARVAGAGWLGTVAQARKALADRLLRQTSFDVSVSRWAEQEFHLRTLEVLETIASQPEAVLQVFSGGRERSVAVAREAMAADLRSLADSVVAGARDLLVRAGLGFGGVPVYLTARARRLCGLDAALRARGAVSSINLAPGAAARGAAVLACGRTRPDDLADVPVETSIALAKDVAPASAAMGAAFTFARPGLARGAEPTHIVVDGVAHALGAHGRRFMLGAGAANGAIPIPIEPAGVGRCELVVERGADGWHVAAWIDGARRPIPGGEVPLAPGDVLEVHGAPGLVRLMAVRVAG